MSAIYICTNGKLHTTRLRKRFPEFKIQILSLHRVTGNRWETAWIEEPDPVLHVEMKGRATSATVQLSRYPSQRAVLEAYPRIAACLICESLGYFTPAAAANAIVSMIHGLPYACEYYSHLTAGMDGEDSNQNLIEVGRQVYCRAVRLRQMYRSGQEYHRALQTVSRELAGNGPLLASWLNSPRIHSQTP